MVSEPMVIVNFKVTPQEQKLIERQAKKDKMNVSDYVRSCVYMDLLLAGDLEAMRLLGKRAWDRLAPRLKGLGWARAEE